MTVLENEIINNDEMGTEVMEMPENQEPVTEAKKILDGYRDKYKFMDNKIYEVTTTIQEDDESEKEMVFIFRKPNTASYDRYVKTSSASSSRALRTFIMDNIIEEQRDNLQETLEEYPALAISVGEKLLNMLGLSKETTVKKL